MVIAKDYWAYIEKLPPEESRLVTHYDIWFFKNFTGQHAVQIKIPLNGTWWEHFLIYDQENKRIRVIKHASGGYAS